MIELMWMLISPMYILIKKYILIKRSCTQGYVICENYAEMYL